MIPGLKGVSYESRLKRLKLWTLEDRRVGLRADLIEVLKMFRGFVVDIDTFFESDSWTYPEVKEESCRH